MDIQKLWEENQELIMTWGANILKALVVLIIGMWIIKRILKLVVRGLEKREIDPTIIPTLRGTFKVGLIASLIFAVVGILGIPTSGFLAIFGAAGLAIGLALQGSLSNFAGGILILTLKPFKAGDVINVNGETGKVHAVTIINTVLKTPDNKTIYLPNGAVAGANITNFTQEDTRRLDQVYGVGYDDDFDKAKNIILGIIEKDERIIRDPEPFARVGNLGDSSVDITLRAWVKTDDYWDVHFDMIEKVKKAFDQEGISIPYPQRDIHVFNEK